MGNLTGTASTASFATTAFKLDGFDPANFNASTATYSTKSGVSTDVIGGIASVTSLFVGATGISTLGIVKISSGIVTSNIVGTSVTYYGDGSKLTNIVASYASTAGISTNLKGSTLNAIPFQAGIDSTSFLPTGSPGNFLKSNGSSLPPSWDSLPTTSISVADTTSTVVNFPLFIDNTGNTSTLSISKSLFAFVPQNNNPRLGIGTTSPTFNLDVNGTGRFIGTVSASSYFGTNLNISGITTIGTGNTGVVINGTTGIITSIGITTVTFVGNLTGTASTASFATTAFNLNGVTSGDLKVAYASTAGIATNVIGGIASVTSLFVDTTGISTFGGSEGVLIKYDGVSGIVTSAHPGVTTVTYYGDGSKLTGIGTAASATNVALTTDTSSTTTNIVFSQTPNQNPTSSLKTNPGLIFDASTSSLGIGTTLPLTPLQVEKYGVKTGFGTFVATAGITTDVDSFVIATNNFKTAEYTVHIQSSSSIQAQKVLVMQNGTSAFSQEYAIMYEPTFMISIGATVSGGLCKLQFTPETGTSGLVTYRFARETMI